MITGLMVAAAVLMALPRLSPARVRLPALASARGWRPSMPSSAAAGRWRRPLAGLVVGATARPHRVSSTAGGAVLAAAFLGGVRLPAAMAAGLATTVLTAGGMRAAQSRRVRRDDTALAQGLSVLEAELVAGSREDAALTAAAAVSGRHGRLLREAAAGIGYGSVTAEVLARSPSFLPLAAAWRVRHACGAPLAEVVAQVAHDVDLRRKRQLAVDSALAGPRSSSALLAALPLVGMGLGTVMGARPFRFLFATTGGSTVLLVGVGLDVTGWLWTAAMVRRASR